MLSTGPTPSSFLPVEDLFYPSFVFRNFWEILLTDIFNSTYEFVAVPQNFYSSEITKSNS